MLVGPVHEWEVWARYSQRELASSNIHTSTTALRQKRPFRQGAIYLEQTSLRFAQAVQKIRHGLMQCSKKDRYSITSSARASSVGGIVRPRMLAVLRLTTVVNLSA